MLNKPKERPALKKGDLGEGPTIIYVPTRKETLSIAKFLSSYGVKAAAYNAKVTVLLYFTGFWSCNILHFISIYVMYCRVH